MKRIVVSLMLLISTVVAGFSQAKFNPSGDDELDIVRREVLDTPTSAETFRLRALKMKLWVVSLQQEGVPLKEYVPIDQKMSSIVWWNTIDLNKGRRQEFTAEQMVTLGATIDEGYRILNEKQGLLNQGFTLEVKSKAKRALDYDKQEEVVWTHYKGNEGQTGYTGASGAVKGELDWKYPVGLAWESSARVEGDRVYLSSPGMRNTMLCLDIDSGEELWSTTQEAEIMGDQLYNTPSNQSTPIVLNDYVLYRELGARGNSGPTKHICYVDKKTGEISRKVEASHVDYRAGYAPFDANERFVVYAHGIQDIHEHPPVAQGFNKIVVCDTKTGRQLWSVVVGSTFAEPKIDDSQIYIGTKAGYLYAYTTNERYWFARPAKWQFKAGGAINKKVEVTENRVVFGANDGVIYCLNKFTGKLLWSYDTGNVVASAFRHFSKPTIEGNIAVFGSADNHVYGLNIESGKLLFKGETDDWVRSAPVVVGDNIYVASIGGELYGWSYKGGEFKSLFEKKLSEHPIYADITATGDKLLINDSDLYAYCVDLKGNQKWRKSVIKSFVREGERILSDQIAGGAYYQSKPTVVEDIVYFGTPSRFVYALNAKSGEEIWKYELGAAISGAPVYGDGKIFIGQQGGEESFYALDAKSGELKWRQSTGWVWGSANYSDSMVFVPCIDGNAMALDANTGAMIWKDRFGLSVCSEPAVSGDKVVFGCWDGFMKCYDKRSGELLWQRQGSGTDSGVAIINGDRLYFKNKCVDMNTGELVWEFHDGRSVFNITPAYHDGKVYLSCWHGLGLGGICVEAVVYCVDALTGEKLWTNDGAGLSSPVIDNNGCVYFPSIADPYFYCVDVEGNGDGTTTTRWIYKMGNKVEESTPAIYKGRIYVISSDGFLHVIK